MSGKRFLLDGNIYNRLDSDPDVSAKIRTLVEDGRMQIVASPVLVTELQRSPFGGIPSWFKVDVLPEGVAISGLARSGMARAGAGRTYKSHLGNSSRQGGIDAILAESAQSMRAILVSDDVDCLKRLSRVSNPPGAMTYAEFKNWVTQEAPD